jgi:hypothetical protein
MHPRVLHGFFLSLIVGVGALIASLHHTNVMLEARMRAAHNQQAARSADPTSALAATSAASIQPASATGDAREHLAWLQARVAALEQHAETQYAAQTEATDAPSTNRDPEKGMTRLEYMRNVGQGTPAAALQTLFWAALNGEDEAMARTINYDDKVRPQAMALIEHLPVELRKRYPTPEHLCALIITRKALDVSAIQIVETVYGDSANASLTVRGLTGADQHLPMHLGSQGWQLLVAEPQLKYFRDELENQRGN